MELSTDLDFRPQAEKASLGEAVFLLHSAFEPAPFSLI